MNILTMKKGEREDLLIPLELQIALARHPALERAFPTFSSAHRREYIHWVAEAKRPETRAKRATQAVAMILAKWEQPR